MKKVLLPLGLALSLIVIFVLGVVVAESVTKNREKVVNDILVEEVKAAEMRALNSAAETYFEDFDKLELDEEKPLITSYEDSDKNKVLARYQIIKENAEVGILYYIEVVGKNEGLRVAVVIEPTSRNILGYKIVVNNESTDYFEKLDETFFNQFVNVDMKKPVFDFTPVATITLSSKAIIRVMKMAREQFYQDIDEELPIPSVDFTFVSAVQWLSDISIFTYTMSDGTRSVDAKLKYDTSKRELSFVDADTVLSEEEIEALVATANQNKPAARITAYNPNTRVFTVSSTGYNGPIICNITLDENGKVTGYTVGEHDHDESYIYSPQYSEPDPIINIPKLIRESGDTEGIETITGATVTSNALIRAANVAMQSWRADK
ncbi:MAG TPA: FMN-binding protein [Bacilli bacterium]|nr:FMN-binding protein [Bacilli bacterium]